MKRYIIIVFMCLYFIGNIPGYSYENNYFNLDEENIQYITNIIGENLASSALFLNPSKPILFSTLVNLNNFNETCELARIIQQEISSYFIKKGYSVKEILLKKDSILIKKQKGEFILSRDISQLKKEYNIGAFITGTYTLISNNEILITLKIISTKSNTGISSYSFVLYIPRKYKRLVISQDINKQGTETNMQKKLFNKNDKKKVKLIQKRLKKLGLYNGEIDGIWGEKTQRAIEIFKKIKGLKPVSTWDIKTQESLFQQN